MGAGGIGAQLGEIENPASGGAVEVGHVDEHLVDFLGSENLLGLRARRKSCEIRGPGSLGGVIGLGMRIGPGNQRAGGRRTHSWCAAEAGNSMGQRMATTDAYVHAVFSAARWATACPAIGPGCSVWRAAGDSGLLAFG